MKGDKILDKPFKLYDKNGEEVVPSVTLSELGWKAVKTHLEDGQSIEVFMEDDGQIWWKGEDPMLPQQYKDRGEESLIKLQALRKILKAYEDLLNDKNVEREVPLGYIKHAIFEVESIYRTVEDE